MQLNTKSLINGKANPGKRFCDWNSLGISAVENRKKKSKARQVLRLVLMNNVSGYDFFLVSLLLSAEGGVVHCHPEESKE